MEDEILIECVRDYGCLYIPADPKYLDIQYKISIRKIIAERLLQSCKVKSFIYGITHHRHVAQFKLEYIDLLFGGASRVQCLLSKAPIKLGNFHDVSKSVAMECHISSVGCGITSFIIAVPKMYKYF